MKQSLTKLGDYSEILKKQLTLADNIRILISEASNA